MCQHVLGSRCARSSEQDRQAGVGVRVPGSALHRLDGGRRCSRRVELRFHDQPECVRKGEVGERQRRERGARGAREAKAVSEDPREIGKPRWNVGGVSDERGVPALRGLASWSFVRDRRGEALGLEEARPPEGVQPGSGGGRSRALGHGSQSRRVENGFYPAAWPQGGLEATHRRQSALFSRPLATSIQVRVLNNHSGPWISLLTRRFLGIFVRRSAANSTNRNSVKRSKITSFFIIYIQRYGICDRVLRPKFFAFWLKFRENRANSKL